MVTNLHERKFKTTKNSSVNQKTKFWGNLRVNFQCEGQLKFFDVVGSFFSRALDLLLTLEENSCFELFTGDCFHTNCPCVWPSTPWMSKTVRIFIIPVVGVIQPQHFGFFQTSGSFWSTGRDPFSTLGDYVWHQTKKPYTFVFTFHVDDSGIRKCEVQHRDGWKSTINHLCAPSEKGNKHCFLSWVTSKE